MKIALPNKGRLHAPSFDLLCRAGIKVRESQQDRKLWADTSLPDVTVIYVRSEDIPRYISSGAADIGITGYDQIQEKNFDNIIELLDLDFGKCKIVVATLDPRIGNKTSIESIEELQGKTIATEFPHITKTFFMGRDIDVKIIEVGGATEITPHVQMADAIVDIVSSGDTLRSNQLVILDEILTSSARLISRKDIQDKPLANKISDALLSVVSAKEKRYLMMNAPRDKLEQITSVLPGLSGPTVIDTSGSSLVVVHAVVNESEVFETIGALKIQGATGILVTRIDRLVE
tara:strand:- start:23803 stop:24669 length:867 start_codon:yes stop_codon:yes gene_type:complete